MPIPADRSISGFFKADFNPYYILAPHYLHSSAGVRSLHYLCHALNEFGCEAYLAPVSPLNPALRTPCLTPEILQNHYISGRTPIALYPETISGNPFQTPHVARWLLNRAGHLGGPTTFHSSEALFYFAKWVLDPGIEARHLTVPTADLHLFNNNNNPFDTRRSGACYYANKYLHKGHQIPADIANQATSLCLDIPRSPEEIAAILQRSTVLYCFEETALITEALLCGCPVLLVQSEYMRPENWKPDGIPPGCGWAHESGVLERLTQEVGQFRNLYEKSHQYCWNTVHQFIIHTHHRFTLSKGESQTQEGPASEIQKFWTIPKERRQKYLNNFLHACSETPVFSEWKRNNPIMKLAGWLDETIVATRPIFPPDAPSPPSVASSNIRKPLVAKEEHRLLEQVNTLLQAGQNDQAILLLTRLVAHDTLCWEVYDSLGQIYAEQNNLDEAALVLLKGASLEFSSTHCLRKLAAVFAMQGELWRTLAACAQILKREPDDQELHLFVRDVLVSTSPRFDNISWLAPEWAKTMDALSTYKNQAQAARNLLDNLQAKAQSVLAEHHPLTSLGNGSRSHERQ
ncbi:tetratricopeptide repeat protein [Oryzomicrobium sp.]|uniref:tetratricopeptide repeat protein n=1 Tax=Oryzomicrobium sp. TaxID=1911578 RepID=UPI002FE33E4A